MPHGVPLHAHMPRALYKDHQHILTATATAAVAAATNSYEFMILWSSLALPCKHFTYSTIQYTHVNISSCSSSSSANDNNCGIKEKQEGGEGGNSNKHFQSLA